MDFRLPTDRSHEYYASAGTHWPPGRRDLAVEVASVVVESVIMLI